MLVDGGRNPPVDSAVPKPAPQIQGTRGAPWRHRHPISRHMLHGLHGLNPGDGEQRTDQEAFVPGVGACEGELVGACEGEPEGAADGEALGARVAVGANVAVG